MVASARARFVYPDLFCHPILPFSAMSWRWRSRWVGAVSAVSLGTAVERGGTMMAASGWRSATLPGRLLGAEPDDPARHAGVATPRLKASPATARRPPSELRTKAEHH